jgi:hypothetical protein
VVLQILEHDFSDTDNKLWPAKNRATETGNLDTDQGQAAPRMYLLAAEINEVEEPEDPATGGQDNAYGGTQTRATRER